MNEHRMNLRGPWQIEWLSGEERSPKSMRLPVEWRDALGHVSGQIRLTRRFGCPPGLTDRHRLLFRFDGVGGTGVVRLNGHPLGTIESCRGYDLPIPRVELRNELQVELKFDPEAEPNLPGGLWGLVGLVILEPE